ncbi:pentatricopeptide repeat-containing protein At3g59040-like [Vicia villosa]|uniref:pentatricopeptide repeat-containing protein At3g59040-like n=1 Tax=Vicia villosa TaxID=3911 RepID=UPI00273B050D|nr:pentatricopeptide repeat-containing protein At3g59040-like [Vicia villosa]
MALLLYYSSPSRLYRTVSLSLITFLKLKLKKELPSIHPDLDSFHFISGTTREEYFRKGVNQFATGIDAMDSGDTKIKEQRANLRLDMVSYALLINAYGKARREDEALAVFKEMLDASVRYARE